MPVSKIITGNKMQKKLYLDITSGISGDMFLALLINLGANADKLSNILTSMLNKKIQLSTHSVFKNDIICSRLIIDTDIEGEPFRHFSDIKEMIETCKILSQTTKEKAIKAFRIIAEAESDVHNLSIEEIHFHEIGAVDTIIDIVGVAWCLEELGIEEIVSSPAACGRGTIKTCHGILPLPAPATLKILKDIPLNIIDTEGELTTPTGAALMKTFVSRYDKNLSLKVIQDGYSTGALEFEGVPNILRGMVFNDTVTSYNDKILSFVCNIDDMTGEAFGQLMQQLMQTKGVLDVFYTPAYGKKNRPLYALTLLSEMETKDDIVLTLFRHSSTAGVRIREENRLIMGRSFVEREIYGEKIKIKRLFYENYEKFYPEWDDCVKIAEKLGKTAHEIYTKAASEENL